MVRQEACAALFSASLLMPGHAKAQTVTWFLGNPGARASVLAQCRDDLSLHRTAACQNAEAAETLAFARRTAPGRDGPAPAQDAAPFVRRAIERACTRPPAERGMFAPYCTRRL